MPHVADGHAAGRSAKTKGSAVDEAAYAAGRSAKTKDAAVGDAAQAAGRSGKTKDPAAEDAGTPLSAVGDRVLRRQWALVIEGEHAVRSADEQDRLRKVRVAVRRLREALRVFSTQETRPFVDSVDTGVRLLAQNVGIVRDLDVLATELRTDAADRADDATALGILIGWIGDQRQARHRDLVQYLDGPDMEQLRAAMPRALDRLAADHDGGSVGHVADDLLRRRLRQVHEAGRSLLSPTSAELHTLRIRCKRFRYACEFLNDYYSGRLDGAITAATKLQDSLGAVHDGDVAAQALLAVIDAAGAAQATEVAGLAAAVLRSVVARLERRDASMKQVRERWEQLKSLPALPAIESALHA